jgi:hypothetical protein
MNHSFDAPPEITRWQNIALGVGVLFTVLCFVGWLTDHEQAYRSWLLGFIFWGGIGFGSLGILILQYLTGGAWGVVIRRFVEAGSRTIPIIGILFLPILWAVITKSLYLWTTIPTDDIVKHRYLWMNIPAFGIRAIIFFGLLSVMAYLLNKWSLQQDQTTNYEDSAKLLGKATAFCGPTMVFYALVVSFMAIDWLMTLDPHWYSTIWGLLYVVGWALSCFAFLIALLANLADKEPMNRILGNKHFHDIGKLMLALVMVWAYFNFSQFLIIWSGNLPEETGWLLKRMKGPWGYMAIGLIVLHFAVPYILLLSRDLKRNSRLLSFVAIFILVMRLIDMYFHIGPSPYIGMDVKIANSFAPFNLSWMDFAAPIAVGGIWLWAYFGELKKRPLVPTKDPFFENAIAHGKGH